MHLDLVDAQQQAETESKKDEFPELKGTVQYCINNCNVNNCCRLSTKEISTRKVATTVV